MITNLTQSDLVEVVENPEKQGNKIKLKDTSFRNSKRHIWNIPHKTMEKPSASMEKQQHSSITKKIIDIKSEITLLIGKGKDYVLNGFKPINVKENMKNNMDNRYQKFLRENITMEETQQSNVDEAPNMYQSSEYYTPEYQASYQETEIPFYHRESTSSVSEESVVGTREESDFVANTQTSIADNNRNFNFDEHYSQIAGVRGELQQMQEEVKEAQKLEEESARKLADAEVKNNEMQKKIADATENYKALQRRYLEELEKQKNLMGNMKEDLSNQIQQSKAIAEKNDYKAREMHERLLSNTEVYNNLVQKTAELEKQMKSLQQHTDNSNIVQFPSSEEEHYGYGRVA